MAVSLGRLVRPAVPTRVVLDQRGEPALVEIEAECTQHVARFWFSLPPDDYMFDTPASAGSNHILIRHDVEVDGMSVTFFQDSGFRSQLYYEPQEFRLGRTPDAPYTPDCLVSFYDAVDDAGVFHYRVRLAFRLRPYVDPRVLERARALHGADARFTALDPVESSLSLRLPLEEAGGDFETVERAEAEILFDDGIWDTLDLSSDEFQRVFAAFEGPDGVGVEGVVDATLFDGTVVDIPVRLGLSEATGMLFDRTFRGSDDAGPGRCVVELRNRIESPVTVRGVHGVMPARDVVAQPVDAGTPTTVAPGASMTVTYRVTPDDAAVLDLEPALTTTVETDHERVWPMIMINEGYAAETFELTAAIDRRYFDGPPPAGMPPLTGVRVRFEPDVEIVLTPDALRKSVELRKPLLAWLMRRDEAERYEYRVINLHADGPGAESELREGVGGVELDVTPASSEGGP